MLLVGTSRWREPYGGRACTSPVHAGSALVGSGGHRPRLTLVADPAPDMDNTASTAVERRHFWPGTGDPIGKGWRTP